MSEVTVSEQVINLPVNSILADDNIRFGLIDSRTAELADQIAEHGGVHTPLWVEELEEPVEGFPYRLTAGNYRLAALKKLNAEGAGLMAPCLIRPVGEGIKRLLSQLSENRDRENMSPMDKAMAMKKLLDSGMSRLDIRKQFPAVGGGKGKKGEPCSNASLNMIVSFLQFPKAIQNKIHLGSERGGIGVATAYALTKTSKDRWESVLAAAEEDRAKIAAQEVKDEEKYLADERKKQEAEQKAESLGKELESKKQALQVVSQELDAANEAEKELFAKTKSKASTEDEQKAKAEAEAALKKLQAENKEREKKAASLKSETEKMEEKYKSAADLAKERAEKLADLRLKAGAKAKATSPTPGDINKAATAQGATTNYVALNATEMRSAVHGLCAPGSYPKVQLIGSIIDKCFKGQITENECSWELAFRVTGELAIKPKHLVKEEKEAEAAAKAAAKSAAKAPKGKAKAAEAPE